MTKQELIDYYASLLIMQYSEKPNAVAMIKALVEPVIMDKLPLDVMDAFDIDTAVGDQLDIIAKYVGISRRTYTFTEEVILDDADFRTLIKVKIIQNNSGTSFAEIQQLLWNLFSGAIKVFDYQTMNMSYIFDAAYGSVTLAEVFVQQNLLPKPMGVQVGALIYSANINNIFGFRTYTIAGAGIKGFNSYADYQTDWPWLNHDNVIIKI